VAYGDGYNGDVKGIDGVVIREVIGREFGVRHSEGRGGSRRAEACVHYIYISYGN